MTGDLQIVKMSNEGAAEPWIYDATFAWAGGGALRPRRLVGDAEMRVLLHELGVTDIDRFVAYARDGRVIGREISWFDDTILRRWDLL